MDSQSKDFELSSFTKKDILKETEIFKKPHEKIQHIDKTITELKLIKSRYSGYEEEYTSLIKELERIKILILNFDFNPHRLMKYSNSLRIDEQLNFLRKFLKHLKKEKNQIEIDLKVEKRTLYWVFKEDIDELIDILESNINYLANKSFDLFDHNIKSDTFLEDSINLNKSMDLVLPTKSRHPNYAHNFSN